MRKLFTRTSTVAVAAVAVTTAGVAFAAWTSNGVGSGSAAAGANMDISATTAKTSGLLYPSGTAAVTLTLVNPNPYPVKVTEINGDGAIVSGEDTCDSSTGVTFADQKGSWVIPAKAAGEDGTLLVTLSAAASMSNASHNACQNQIFTIPVALVGASS
jgi:hypothetical protein